MRRERIGHQRRRADNILQRVEQRQASKNAHRQLLFYDS
ncbi:Uncharacterised protein [Shigella flexneri]|nr:Uncharacterised protein [Shigella flexneri]